MLEAPSHPASLGTTYSEAVNPNQFMQNRHRDECQVGCCQHVCDNACLCDVTILCCQAQCIVVPLIDVLQLYRVEYVFIRTKYVRTNKRRL